MIQSVSPKPKKPKPATRREPVVTTPESEANHKRQNQNPFGPMIVAQNLDVDAIRPSPYQPRRDFPADELYVLGASMLDQGQVQPIIVRLAKTPSSRGKPSVDSPPYELIEGERRLRAAKLMGIDTIRAEIVEASDAQVREIVLVSAIHRRDLNPIEEALGLRAMLDAKDSPGVTELARKLGLAQGTVSNRLRLLELPEWWREKLISREITERHARAILPHKDDTQIMQSLQAIMDNLLTTKECPTVSEWESKILPATCEKWDRQVGNGKKSRLADKSENGRSVSKLADHFLEEDKQPSKSPTAHSSPYSSGKGMAYDYRRTALSKLIADVIRGGDVEPDGLLSLLLVAAQSWELCLYFDDIAEAVAAVGWKKTVRYENLLSILWEDGVLCESTATRLLSQCFWDYVNGLPHGVVCDAAIEEVAKLLDIDLEFEWNRGECCDTTAFWNGHTTNELLDLARETKLAKIAEIQPLGLSKEKLVAAFVKAVPTPDGKEAGLKMPKCLKQPLHKRIKPAKPPKQKAKAAP